MDMRTVARTCLLVGLLLAMAGCGGAPVAKAPVSPSVRILSPTNGQKEVASGSVVVTVRLSVSNFTTLLPAGPEAAGSGQVWLYENGRLLTQMVTTSFPLLLQPGTYHLKAVLVTNGKPVASSASVVVSITSMTVASAESLTKACDTQPSGGTQGLKPGTITMFCKGLPTTASDVSSLVTGPGGDLWFIVSKPSCGCGPGTTIAIGRITPSGTITVFTKGLPADSYTGRLVVGPGGDLWFTDAAYSSAGNVTLNSIGRITPSGVITVFSKGLPAYGSVRRLVVGPGGDLWFTEGPSGAPSPTLGIGRITPSGVITVFTKGLSVGSAVRCLVVGLGGDLWFTVNPQSTNGTGVNGIGRITPSGVITVFTEGPPADSVVGSLVVGPGGDLWFTDAAYSSAGNVTLNSIGRITPSGVITVFTKGLPADSLVSWLMMGPGGDLWFTEGPPGYGWPGSGIGRITPSGVITMFTKGLTANSQISYPGLMTGPDGNLWFTDGNSIGRITPFGVITVFTKGLPASSNISGLMTGPDDNLWFTDGMSIGRITPSGVITMFTESLPGNSQISQLMTGPDGNLWFTISPLSGPQSMVMGRLIP